MCYETSIEKVFLQAEVKLIENCGFMPIISIPISILAFIFEP